MYIADLSPCGYSRGNLHHLSWYAPLLAVGWLARHHAFPAGQPPEGLADRLTEMGEAVREIFGHTLYRGLHECCLCWARGIDTGGLPGSHANLLIPGEGVIYAAPAAIAHYVARHDYLPPAAFVEAVWACPEYGSEAYMDTLRAANRGQEPPIETYEAYLQEARVERSMKRYAARRRFDRYPKPTRHTGTARRKTGHKNNQT